MTAPFGPTNRGGWRGVQGLQRRCEKRPLFRTVAGSVVLGDPQLARTALVDRAGRLGHDSPFWRLGPRPLPDELGGQLNHWVRGALAGTDPARVAAIAVDRLLSGGDDLHRLCLHALTDAMAGPLGFADDPQLHGVVRRFVDEVFVGLVTGSGGRADRHVFSRISAAAAAQLGRRPDGLPEAVAEFRMDGEPVIGEVYLRAVTAFVGAPAVSLAWLVHALYADSLVAARRVSDQPDAADDAPADAVALEVLRLWPPAWHLRRRVLHDHPIGPVKVRSGDDVVIPVYALQRHPALWPHADRFDPRRWIGRPHRPAPFLAFATGPGACPGAAFELQWLAAAATQLRDGAKVRVTAQGRRPCVTAVLSPPRARVA